MTKRNLEGHEFILLYRSQYIIESRQEPKAGTQGRISRQDTKAGSQGRELKAGIEAEAIEECSLLAYSPWFALLAFLFDAGLGMALYTMGQAFHINHQSIKCPTGLPIGQFDGDSSSNNASPF